MLNRHSQEQFSDTPDFILAGFLLGVLDQWNYAVVKRDEWHEPDRG